MTRIELPDIVAAQPLHHLSDCTYLGRRRQQVDVVVHEYVGVEPATGGKQYLA